MNGSIWSAPSAQLRPMQMGLACLCAIRVERGAQVAVPVVRWGRKGERRVDGFSEIWEEVRRYYSYCLQVVCGLREDGIKFDGEGVKVCLREELAVVCKREEARGDEASGEGDERWRLWRSGVGCGGMRIASRQTG
eukprot:4289138-Pleurochrysis_carterae.AAC.2